MKDELKALIEVAMRQYACYLDSTNQGKFYTIEIFEYVMLSENPKRVRYSLNACLVLNKIPISVIKYVEHIENDISKEDAWLICYKQLALMLMTAGFAHSHQTLPK